MFRLHKFSATVQSAKCFLPETGCLDRQSPLCLGGDGRRLQTVPTRPSKYPSPTRLPCCSRPPPRNSWNPPGLNRLIAKTRTGFGSAHARVHCCRFTTLGPSGMMPEVQKLRQVGIIGTRSPITPTRTVSIMGDYTPLNGRRKAQVLMWGGQAT